MTLKEAYDRHCVTGPDIGHGDKGGTHSYIETYEKLISPFSGKLTLMEMGLAQGLSMEMWRDWLPNALLVGVDQKIVFDREKHNHPMTRLIEADVTKPEFLNKLEHLRFDVVIDDASHMMADQVATFRMLKPRMNVGGVYVIEDILDLGRAESALRAQHSNVEVVDLRQKKGRFDDVLVIYRF